MISLSIDDNFVWREVSPGMWQRDADEAEVFYSSLVKQYAGSGRMHFAITGHVSLAIPVTEGQDVDTVTSKFDVALRTAWLRLRHQLPSIGSQVHFDSHEQKWKKSYQTVSDDGACSSWLDKTFRSVSSDQTGVEWAISDPSAPELATLFITVVPASSGSPARRDVVLRSPHDIIDGIGTLQLLNAFLHHVSEAFSEELPAQLAFCDGLEAERLSTPYHVAAAVPPVPTPEQQGKQGVAHAIPTGRASKLLATLNPVGATPYHDFHTAIVMAVRDLHTESLSAALAAGTQVEYIKHIVHNGSPRWQSPFSGLDHPAAVYNSICGIKLDATMLTAVLNNVSARQQELLDILAQMRQFYHSLREDKDHLALAPYIWAAATPSLTLPQSEKDGRNVLAPLPNSKPSVSLSSMGLVDKLNARALAMWRPTIPA
ncbi:hypothetical protein B0T21DRAFT_347542 [Apiosordaria backusii]|uniref:Uncharacterized protein n=1 Tax=Apiosordaria backusii TaxID=314023 RepID=A0AA40BMW0_9PEZI|nr:hypothetical protein B0T21DRAFT_347542 [Apiosordaria backusii]